jgi:hypothetical protein
MLPQLDELLLDIVAAALGDENHRLSAEKTLRRLEQQGWKMRPAIERLWAGERNSQALGDGLDETEAQLVNDALDLLEMSRTEVPAHSSPDDIPQESEITPGQAQALQALLLNLPVNVRLAVMDQDSHALWQALQSLPDGQRQPIVEELLEAGLLDGEHIAADEFLDDLEPVLWAAACAAASGDLTARLQVQEFFANLEGGNGPLGSAVLQIWAGERDYTRLVAGLPEGTENTSSRAIERILEMLNGLADGA